MARRALTARDVYASMQPPSLDSTFARLALTYSACAPQLLQQLLQHELGLMTPGDDISKALNGPASPTGP